MSAGDEHLPPRDAWPRAMASLAGDPAHDSPAALMETPLAQGPIWIIDSQTKVIEAYRYSSEDYVLVAKVGSGEVLRIEPFAEIELRTAVIFGDEDDEE